VTEGPWRVFGNRTDVEFDELVDIGRALMGLPPQHYEWVQIREDRNAYRVGPKNSGDPNDRAHSGVTAVDPGGL